MGFAVLQLRGAFKPTCVITQQPLPTVGLTLAQSGVVLPEQIGREAKGIITLPQVSLGRQGAFHDGEPLGAVTDGPGSKCGHSLIPGPVPGIPSHVPGTGEGPRLGVCGGKVASTQTGQQAQRIGLMTVTAIQGIHRLAGPSQAQQQAGLHQGHPRHVIGIIKAVALQGGEGILGAVVENVGFGHQSTPGPKPALTGVVAAEPDQGPQHIASLLTTPQ